MMSNRGMEKPKPTAPDASCIRVGRVVLRVIDGRTLTAEHDKMREPIELDAKQLERWALRQLREQVA